MKREDVDDDDDEEQDDPNVLGAKKPKERMTADELRAAYREKIASAKHLADANVLDMIWGRLIVQSKWTFKDTMEFISNTRWTWVKGDAKIAVMLSDYLSRANFPWKHWFFMEFPDMVRELHMKWIDEEIPYPWLKTSWERMKRTPLDQHEDDVLFVNVVWRSCYMRTAMFRRRCAKYYADFFVSSAIDNYHDMDVVRDSVRILEQDGRTIVRYKDKRHGRLVYYNLDKRSGRDPQHSVAWKVWPTYTLSLRHRTLVSADALAFHPDVGENRKEVKAGQYRYNFAPKTVEAFIRWYRVQLIKNGTIREEGGDDVYVSDTFKQHYGNFGNWILERVPMEVGSIVLGFRIIDPKTSQESWPDLEWLDMCPRRRQYYQRNVRALQFLGAQDLGE
jgi:hypothetical protein